MGTKTKVTNKIIDLTKSHSHLSKLTSFLLNSNIISKNPIYANFYRMQMEKIMLKQKDGPVKVIIENTNACNAHCVFCTHDKLTRKIGYMDFSLFKKIIADCASLNVKEVAIYRFGEPLLDPGFSEKVAFAKKAGIEIVSTNTNASLLTEETAIKILDSGLDVIYISLDGNSKETYEKIRKGLNYDVVTKNINRFIELKNYSHKEKPAIIINLCLLDENKNQVKDFVRKWSKHGQVWISNTHDWSGKAEEIKAKKAKRIVPCRLLWTELVISWDGRVPMCCVDFDDKLIIGNLKNESIRQVWSGERLKKSRKIHLDGDFNKISLCQNCTCYFSWWMRDWAA
jgi:radical SAM protein with 4Fe4S-binding SPASM domain